jgi:hypothetical protein
MIRHWEDNNTGVNRPCTRFLITTGRAFFLAKDPCLAVARGAVMGRKPTLPRAETEGFWGRESTRWLMVSAHSASRALARHCCSRFSRAWDLQTKQYKF